MTEAPFALAFTAGLVATVNPCGFAMLPAYLSYFMGLDDGGPSSDVDAWGRGLRIGGLVSVGFLVVFGLVGLLVTAGMRSVVTAVPWAAMVVGVGLVGLGAAMLAGHEPRLRVPGVRRAGDGRDTMSMVVFGGAYAVASLSCTLPVFLVVVAGAIPSASLAGGVLLFLVYGLGMALVLVVVTIALALGRRGLVDRLRRSSAHVHRVSGAVMVVAGGYIVWFWATNLDDPLAASGAGTLVETWSSRLTELIGDRPLLWGAGLGAVVLATAVIAWQRRRRPSSTGRADVTDPSSHA